MDKKVIYKYLSLRSKFVRDYGFRFANGALLRRWRKSRIDWRTTICIERSSALRNCTIFISGDGNRVEFGPFCALNGVELYIKGSGNRIVIGASVRIKQNTQLWIEDSGNTLEIGAGSSIESAHLAVTGLSKKLVIGGDCMLSTDVVIRTGDSHSITDLKGRKINEEKDVYIGNHVWIGASANLLKGSLVSDNSVVGTGAIVSSAFPEKGVIIAGVPAKVIKSDINWRRERFGGSEM